MNKQKPISNVLENLVENAFDFLEQSISEVSKKPKYSVIHFHAALELFLKARLGAEHWSLIVSSRMEADRNAFEKGDFVSVNFKEAYKRLDKIVGSGLSKNQIATFESINNHRNKMVHFYHQVNTKDARQREIREIVKEQLFAWYYLNKLLSEQWLGVFSRWNDRVFGINSKLKLHHAYLKIIFDHVKLDIEKQKNEFDFVRCPICSFEAEKHEKGVNILYDSECLVCGYKESSLKILCAECVDGNVIYRGAPSAICDSCEKEHGEAEIYDVFIDRNEAYTAKKGGGDYPFPLNCGVCCGYESVVEIEDSKYLCVECFHITDNYGVCEFCSDASTELGDNTHYLGCEFCEGYSSRMDD